MYYNIPIYLARYVRISNILVLTMFCKLQDAFHSRILELLEDRVILRSIFYRECKVNKRAPPIPRFCQDLGAV